MNCTNCGSPLTNDAAFCPQCGAKQESMPSGAPGSSGFSKLSKTQRVIVLICIIVAVVMILVLIFGVFGGNSKKNAVKDYFNAIEKCDAGRMMDCIPDKVVDQFMDEEDMSRREMEEELQDEMDDQFQDIDSIKVTFQDTEDWDKDDVEDLSDYFEELYDIKIKDAVTYEVKIHMEANGGDDVKTEETEITVVKIGGSWYCLEAMHY